MIPESKGNVLFLSSFQERCTMETPLAAEVRQSPRAGPLSQEPAYHATSGTFQTGDFCEILEPYGWSSEE